MTVEQDSQGTCSVR